MGKWIVYCILVVAFLATLTVASGIKVEPESIEKIIDKEEIVKVKIKNNKNESVTVYIYSGSEYVKPSADVIAIPANSSKIIDLKLTPSDTDTVVLYVSEEGDVFEQKVKIRDANKYQILVIPEDIDVKITEDRAEVEITIYNPTDKIAKVSVESNLKVSPLEFKAYPGDFRRVFIIADKTGVYSVKYTYDFGFKKGSVIQTVRVEKSDVINKLKELEMKLNLPDDITIEIPEKIKVGEPFEVRVKSKYDVSRIPVSFNGIVKFTDANGVVTFTPKEAGTYTVAVLDRMGYVKIERTIKVEKSKINLSIENGRVGKAINITLPESGKIIIYHELEKILEEDVNSTVFSFIPEEPGMYKVVFKGKSYEGTGTFTVQSGVTIAAYVNNKMINIGEKVEPGSTIEIRVEYDNGMPVKDGYLYIDLPLTMFGVDKKEAILFALVSDKFTPPYNIRIKKPIEDGKVTLVIPEDASGGVINVVFKGDDFVEGSSLTITVAEKKPVTEVLAPYIALAVVFAMIVVAYTYNLLGFRDGIKKLVSKINVKLKQAKKEEEKFI